MWPFWTFLVVFVVVVMQLESLEHRGKHRRETRVTEKYPLGFLRRVR
jgi:hypothetical protein